MRLRDLLSDPPTEPLRVITDFNWDVHHTAATPDGKYFVVEGVGGPKGDTRSVNAYDAPTGAKLWSFPSRKKPDNPAWFRFDPTGKILSLHDHDHTILLEMPTRAVLGGLDETVRCLSPGARRWLRVAQLDTADRSLVCSIHERGRKLPLLQVALNSRDFPVLTQFSPDGRHVVWSNTAGSVSVCDLDEVQRRLAEIALGW